MLLNREKFIADVQRRRRLDRRLLVALLVFFGGLFSFVPLEKWAATPDAPDWAGTAVSVGLFAFIGLYLVGLAIVLRRYPSEKGTTCPHCKALLTWDARRIVVASGNCCYCGEPVFSSA